MTCQFSVPNVKSEWFRNGRILKPQGRHKTEVEHKVHKLTIADVRAEDQGQYTCKYEDLETSAELRIEGGRTATAGVIGAQVNGKRGTGPLPRTPCHYAFSKVFVCSPFPAQCSLTSQDVHKIKREIFTQVPVLLHASFWPKADFNLNEAMTNSYLNSVILLNSIILYNFTKFHISHIYDSHPKTEILEMTRFHSYSKKILAMSNRSKKNLFCL